MAHADACPAVHGRILPVRRVRMEGRPVAHVAEEPGVSRRWSRRGAGPFPSAAGTRKRPRARGGRTRRLNRA
nr:leucine zipper domain-containing protein [Thermostaphylospora chromogena]